jgi:hypothetical protein
MGGSAAPATVETVTAAPVAAKNSLLLTITPPYVVELRECRVHPTLNIAN